MSYHITNSLSKYQFQNNTLHKLGCFLLCFCNKIVAKIRKFSIFILCDCLNLGFIGSVVVVGFIGGSVLS